MLLTLPSLQIPPLPLSMMLSTHPPAAASIFPNSSEPPAAPLLASDFAARAMASKTYSELILLVLAGLRLAFIFNRLWTMPSLCVAANDLAMSLSSPTLVPDRRGARTVLSSRSSKA